ncbi:MAG: hypothetical protein ABIS01_05855, partial [Ferruginibacter sp.]
SNLLYYNCVKVLSISALVSLYFSGNYYVVKEAGTALLNLDVAKNGDLPIKWLFWLFTIVIPFVYIARGIQKKDIILIRIGLLLVAMIVFTIRYYYTIAPIELIMVLAGLILLAFSYGLTHYLKVPKYGFTNIEVDPVNPVEKMHLESIILAQTFSSQPTTSESKGFGGGSFGGGGASGDF